MGKEVGKGKKKRKTFFRWMRIPKSADSGVQQWHAKEKKKGRKKKLWVILPLKSNSLHEEVDLPLITVCRGNLRKVLHHQQYVPHTQRLTLSHRNGHPDTLAFFLTGEHHSKMNANNNFHHESHLGDSC